MDAAPIKTELRRSFRHRRQGIACRELTASGTRIANALESFLEHAPPGRLITTVAAFVAVGAEPPTLPLLSRLIERGLSVMLPRPGEQLREQCWGLLEDQKKLDSPGRGAPPEPAGPRLTAAFLTSADLILVPALAVDHRGNRLGQGGGWYDRALRHARPEVPRIAVLHPHELVDRALPHQPMDVLVHGVLTETGVRWLWRPSRGPWATPRSN